MIGTLKQVKFTVWITLATAAGLVIIGIGLVLVLLNVAHRFVAPDPTARVNDWAADVVKGDYTAAEGMMGDASTHFGFIDLTRTVLQRNGVVGGAMPMYHILATQRAGSSTNATVLFHDHGKAATNTCIQVQISANGVITPLTTYYRCPEAAIPGDSHPAMPGMNMQQVPE
jgi:hypothetical protein